jgi:hypothetical protein
MVALSIAEAASARSFDPAVLLKSSKSRTASPAPFRFVRVIFVSRHRSDVTQKNDACRSNKTQVIEVDRDFWQLANVRMRREVRSQPR